MIAPEQGNEVKGLAILQTKQQPKSSDLVSEELYQTLGTETIERLEALEQYRLPAGLIERLKEKDPFRTMPDAELDECVKEFKKFIAILILNDGKKRTEMTGDLVDEIWHAFILFTREYAEFCEQVMGKFIHHEPNTSNKSDSQAKGDKKGFYLTPTYGIMMKVEAVQDQAYQSFYNDYVKYVGKSPPSTIWDRKQEKMFPESSVKLIEEKRDRTISARSIGVLLAANAVTALALIMAFMAENSKVLGYIVPAILGTLAAAVLLYIRAKDYDSVRQIIVAGYILLLITILTLALSFVILCTIPASEKGQLVFPIGALLVGLVIIIAMFTNNKVKRKSIFEFAPSKKRGGSCGSGGGAYVACSSGGGGGGCGGGGCGGC